jgi:hypothetical protein
MSDASLVINTNSIRNSIRKLPNNAVFENRMFIALFHFMVSLLVIGPSTQGTISRVNQNPDMVGLASHG